MLVPKGTQPCPRPPPHQTLEYTVYIMSLIILWPQYIITTIHYIMTTIYIYCNISIYYKFPLKFKSKYEVYSFRLRTSVMVVRWIFHCSDDVAINYGTFHFVPVGKSTTNTSFIFIGKRFQNTSSGFLTVFFVLWVLKDNVWWGHTSARIEKHSLFRWWTARSRATIEIECYDIDITI